MYIKKKKINKNKMTRILQNTLGFSIFLGLQSLFYHHIYEEVQKDKNKKNYTIYQDYWKCMQKHKRIDDCNEEWRKILLLSDLPK